MSSVKPFVDGDIENEELILVAMSAGRHVSDHVL
jgi:hypothetical protein